MAKIRDKEGDRYLADEVHRILNQAPFTRTAKRSIRAYLLKCIEERRATQLIVYLRQNVERLEVLFNIIRRSRKIPRRNK